MLTKPTRRGTVRLLAGVTVLVSLSGVARAQQSGLFPLKPIRRERTPCSMEDPVYKLYRSQYYGYYPTQWRPFPQGWNLPSPEGPNTREALQKMPIEATAPPSDDGAGDEGPAPPERGDRPAPTPPPENERSPFEMDRDNGGAAAPNAGNPGRRPAPRDNAAPGLENSPFDTPEPDQPAAPRPRAPQPTRPAPGAGATPDLSAPGNPGAAPAPPRTSARDEADRDPGPMLAMPDASLPTIEEASSNGPASAALPSLPAAGTPVADANVPAAAPMQAQQPAQRRSRLGSLFAGMGFNRVRR